ncbi:hypothetical protein BH09PSE4_BH09PSE4_05720 [soil metagenome]
MPLHADFRLAGSVDLAPGAYHNRVYVIDDHSEVRQSLNILLDTFGIVTWSFSGAREFLDQLPSLAPAPLLLDITMPGMSGIELLEELAARKISWPVLIMTGLNDAPVVFRAQALGVMNVLEKPFSAELLESAVTTALTAMADADDDSVTDLL